MQLTKDEIRGLAKIAVGNTKDVEAWDNGDAPHLLDAEYLRPMDLGLWRLLSVTHNTARYELTPAGWEALREYNERTGADVGEDCSAAGND